MGLKFLFVVGLFLSVTSPLVGQEISPAEAREIARDAYIYGFPLVDNYRIHYAYFVDRSSPEFKSPWNVLKNTPRVYTPDDKAVQTPNSDTPYSFVGVDLRTEPLVLTVPEIEKGRYFSIQLIDDYTHNFSYIGTRTTGNGGGNFLLAGPNWNGETPAGITAVFRCETQLAWAVYRTQLFSPEDLPNVIKIQNSYQVRTLSQFQGTAAPQPAPELSFLPPLTPETQRTSIEFFRILNFILQLSPTHPSEKEVMQRFGRLNIGPGNTFDPAKLSPEIEQAIQLGMADAWKIFDDFKTTQIDTLRVTSGDCLGTREYLKNNYLHRMVGAVIGIYGNSREEAMYPLYFVDAAGDKLDGAKKAYQLRFAPGEFPPVDAFWSLTLYELPSSLLSANPINRYLINSPMLPNLKRDADGGVTLTIQHASPGKALESNWLPAPDGPFFLVLRLYQPRPEAYEKKWHQPALQGSALSGQ